MQNRDGKYFNCSEEHELNHVSGKYEEKEKVKEFIKAKCKDKTIHYWTHERLAEYLAENGFRLKVKMTQTELIDKLALSLDGKTQAHKALNAVMDCLTNALGSGYTISLKGFGTFKVVERAARKGRNPQTGKEMEIPASKTIKFTPSSVLKSELTEKE